jgi:hypothetical protein
MIMLRRFAGTSPECSWSSVSPCVLENVCQSRWAAMTSSWRDSAQNPYCSL